MKILFLTSVYPQEDDGDVKSTKTVEYFAKELAKNNKVVVIHNSSKFPILLYLIPKFVRRKLESRIGHGIPTLKSRRPLDFFDGDVKVKRIPILKIVPHSSFSKRQIKKQVRRIEIFLSDIEFVPDIILGHWAFPQLQVLGLLRKKYSCFTSLVFHNDFPFADSKKWKECLEGVGAIGARSETYLELIKTSINRNGFVCYSGIPDCFLSQEVKTLSVVRKRGVHKLVFVGRLTKYKNIDSIIKAMALLNENYSLDIIGSGAEEDSLKSLSISLGVSSRVIFHGQLERKDAFHLLNQADVFVMISSNETFGMVYLEAMLAGCITVGSLSGGIDGVIRNGENGYLCEQGNEMSLARTLSIIESNSAETNDLIREKGRQTALKMSDSNVAKLYLEDAVALNKNYFDC